ncbi:MAG TPA: 4Fe-4S binding protein [Deltaproteobacteria bacterium]|jgi:Na+-translocating ferredoxin:NAD+ oxidoreductase RNF subunit RnfB|nr:4Fe-4S binding protein [Deltaproteobacteria bacterium]
MLTATLVVGGIGAVCALILGISLVTFAVKMDAREKEVMDNLPGANCGACGFAGCAALAHELTVNPDTRMTCPAVNEKMLQAIGEILGRDMGGVSPVIAAVRCRGGRQEAPVRYEYVGPRDCRSAQLIAGGPKGCGYGCLGLGTCATVCPFDAMVMGEDGLPRVITDKCTGCGKCVDACPRDIIALVPKTGNYCVGCISQDAPKDMKKICSVGCIKCGICADVCPFEAIVSEKGKAARIDQDKCRKCGLCVGVCPVSVITSRTAPEKARIIPQKCKGCGICEQVCPVEAISGKAKEPYRVDPGKCMGCGLCIEKCPTEAIERDNT